MPWEKQFDENEVLEKAMRAFWRGGFKGTSMKELVAATGLNPGSIYAAFKGKENLFQLCLAKYGEHTAEGIAALERGYSPKNAILGLFDMVVEEIATGEENCGCFLMNSVLEGGPRDVKVDETIRQGLDRFERMVADMVRKGQEAGDIPATLDPDRTARLLQGLLASARLMGRARPDHPFVKEAREHAEKLLS